MSAVWSFVSRRVGTIAVSPTDGAYQPRVALTVGGRTAECSVFIGHGWTDSALLARVASLIDDDLERLDQQGRAAMTTDGSGTVADYVAFHLEEVAPEVITRVFRRAPSAVDRATYLDRLDLMGLGIHPDPTQPGGFSLSLDYTIGRDVSDQLLVVRVDGTGTISGVHHES